MNILNWFVKDAGSPSRTNPPGTPPATVILPLLYKTGTPLSDLISVDSAHSCNRNKKANQILLTRKPGRSEILYKQTLLRPPLSFRSFLAHPFNRNEIAYNTRLLFDFGALCSNKYERFAHSVRKSLSIRFRNPIERISLSIKLSNKNRFPINTKGSRPPCGHHYRFTRTDSKGIDTIYRLYKIGVVPSLVK